MRLRAKVAGIAALVVALIPIVAVASDTATTPFVRATFICKMPADGETTQAEGVFKEGDYIWRYSNEVKDGVGVDADSWTSGIGGSGLHRGGPLPYGEDRFSGPNVVYLATPQKIGGVTVETEPGPNRRTGTASTDETEECEMVPSVQRDKALIRAYFVDDDGLQQPVEDADVTWFCGDDQVAAATTGRNGWTTFPKPGGDNSVTVDTACGTEVLKAQVTPPLGYSVDEKGPDPVSIKPNGKRVNWSTTEVVTFLDDYWFLKNDGSRTEARGFFEHSFDFVAASGNLVSGVTVEDDEGNSVEVGKVCADAEGNPVNSVQGTVGFGPGVPSVDEDFPPGVRAFFVEDDDTTGGVTCEGTLTVDFVDIERFEVFFDPVDGDDVGFQAPPPCLAGTTDPPRGEIVCFSEKTINTVTQTFRVVINGEFDARGFV